MGAVVSVHRATKEERLQAYRNVHEMWGGGERLETFLRRRLASEPHNRAQWWVLTVDGRVVSSLGRHPLEFSVDGRRVPGFGLAAVHTVPPERGKGYAERLCREVIADADRLGWPVGLLFSDIEPCYYRRLGFLVCAGASDHVCDDSAGLAGGGKRAELAPFDPGRRLEFLERAYGAAHRGDRVFLFRDRTYWRYSLRKSPDLFFAVRDPAGGEAGYLRARPGAGLFEVRELALLDSPGEALGERVFRAAAAEAARRGLSACGGWTEPPPALAPRFRQTSRRDRIPMLRLHTGTNLDTLPEPLPFPSHPADLF